MAFAFFSRKNDRTFSLKELIWHQGIIKSGNLATCVINLDEHKKESGIYLTHIYAYDSGGNAIASYGTIYNGIDAQVFHPIKELSKFMIIMAMGAIGLNSNMIQLIKTGGKPIAVGASCWCGITIVSLIMQHIMKIW